VPQRHFIQNNSSNNSDSSNDLILPQLPLEGESSHEIFDDLKYRRVCADVFSSVLCMIVRYPFEVPLQHPNVSYPTPVDERFYSLKRTYFIDGPLLRKWRDNFAAMERNNNTLFTMDKVRTCLEKEAKVQRPNLVLVMFTRHVKGQAEAELYGAIYLSNNKSEPTLFSPAS
jgi:hypothetical protein